MICGNENMSSPRFGSPWGERPAPPPHATFPTNYAVEEQALLDEDSDDVDELEGTAIPRPERRRHVPEEASFYVTQAN